jgi:hypothetical protein
MSGYKLRVPLQSPPLQPASISREIAALIESSAAAIARLDARVSSSSLASGWFDRAAWSGYTRALQLQGFEIDEIDVFSWGCGLPLPHRHHRKTNLDEFAELPIWMESLRQYEPADWRDRVRLPPDNSSDLPVILAAVHIVHQCARRNKGVAPWLALPGILRGLRFSNACLPCLVGGAKAFRWRASLSDEIIRPILRSLISAAQTGLDRLDAMERSHRDALKAVSGEYRSSSLTRLVALLARRPLLSPQSVATRLGLTLGGAGKLLARSQSLGLTVEVTGRRTWRLYIPPDLAVTFGIVPAPRGRPSKAKSELMPDRPLSEALDAFDEEMAKIDMMLASLGNSRSS